MPTKLHVNLKAQSPKTALVKSATTLKGGALAEAAMSQLKARLFRPKP